MDKHEKDANWKIYYNKHDMNSDVVFYVEGTEKDGVENLFDKKMKDLKIKDGGI
jgi:hypothetical protein